MKVGDKVYVINWMKEYSTLSQWNSILSRVVKIFPWKTELPKYCGTGHNGWEYVYKDNLTKKGTINQRHPRKLIVTVEMVTWL